MLPKSKWSEAAPAIVSVLVTLGFLAVLFIWLWRPVPNQGEGAITVINIMVGSLGTAFAQVVYFWLGSSAGSKDKDLAIKQVIPTTPHIP